jgi:alkylation response protein AidB-like acyl-CoA dehydrogenase
MNFLFTDEQLLFQRTVRDFLEKDCPPSYVRDAANIDTTRPTALWKGLAELGVVGLTVQEEHGGLGRGETDLVLLLEEAGRAALPEPLADATAVGVPLVIRFAPQAFQEEWLPRIAAGEAVLDHSTERLIAKALSGEPIVVPGADLPAAVDSAFDRGAFGTAAVLCGIADRVIELAATYAKERHQFGKPIGSFQAVKHLLADALLGLEFARPAVYRAAWSIAHDERTLARDVSMAKALASDAAFGACRAALQVHGAIGYTHEHDLHLWLNKGFVLANAWGPAPWHRERVARAVLG